MHVSADVEHRVAAKQPEGAGDDEVAAEPVPAETAGQEGAQVLDRLKCGQCPGGSVCVDDASVLVLL